MYVVTQAVDPWLQKLEAARLWTGDAVIMGLAAAELWGLDGIQPGVVEIGTVTRKRLARPEGGFPSLSLGEAQRSFAEAQRHPDVVVHHGVSFPDEDLVRQRGLPTTTPTRTLIDISGCVSAARLTQALDSALRRGLTHIPLIRERLGEIGTQGRAGTRTLQRLLTDRELGSGLTESPLEVKVERALHRAGLDPPERQFTITGPDGMMIGLDFAWPGQRVGIEADGFRWHTDFDQWQQDARKHNLLQEMDWRIVRATHRSLHENPDALPRQVATLLGQTRLALDD